jgi:hypothetical protein
MADNLFINNAFCKAIVALVNFCNEQQYYYKKELKFLKKMPLNNSKEYQTTYSNRFIFNKKQISGVDYK